MEQFWTDGETFRLSISAYIGDQPETARLRIDTRCKDGQCDGDYSWSWKGEPVTGRIGCAQSEAG